jgi:hypothetical protein
MCSCMGLQAVRDEQRDVGCMQPEQTSTATQQAAWVAPLHLAGPPKVSTLQYGHILLQQHAHCSAKITKCNSRPHCARQYPNSAKQT